MKSKLVKYKYTPVYIQYFCYTQRCYMLILLYVSLIGHSLRCTTKPFLIQIKMQQ